MISDEIKQDLRRVLNDASSVGLIPATAELHTCDALLSSRCLAVFFTVIKEDAGLGVSYKDAEEEIAKLVQETKAGSWPRDKHLVLIVPPGVQLDLSEVQRIKADPHVCRKFFCFVDGQDLSRQLRNLPFWPAPILETPAVRLPGFDVLRALATEGFDEVLVQDIYRHTPGVDTMVQNILSNKYRVDVSTRTSHSSDISDSANARSIRAISKAISEQPRRLSQVEIQNFRGIRTLTMNLSANIIFVHGSNGSGKTSVIEALEWIMTGRINRLCHPWPDDDKRQPDPVVNLFSEVDYAAVCLALSLGDHMERVIRHGDLWQSKLRQINDRPIHNDHDIIDEIVGTSAPDEERKLRIEPLRELLRSSHFLGQSTLREFLEKTTPKLRFDSLSKMLGAEAFVFFRRKVDQIIEKLSSHLEISRYEAVATTQIVQNLQANIDKEEKALSAVSTAMGESASGQAADIRNRLAIQGILLSDEQIRLVSISLLGNEAEATAVLAAEQVQTGVSQRKKRISQLRTAVEQFRQQTQLDKSAAQANGEIAKAKAELEELTTQQNLLAQRTGDYRTSLEQQSRSLIQMREELGRNQWLLRSLPVWRRLIREHKDLADRIDELAVTQNAKEEENRKLESEVNSLQDQSAKLKQTRLQMDQKGQKIKGLLAQLPQLQNDLNRLGVLGLTLTSSNGELLDCDSKLQILERQTQEKNDALESVKRALSILEQSITRKVQLLEELRQYIDSSVCPLCGHDHGLMDTLLNRVASKMGVTSPEMKQLQESRQLIEREIADLNMQTQTLSSRIAQLQPRIKSLGEEQNGLTSEIQKFRQDLMGVGIAWPDDEMLMLDRVEPMLFDSAKALSTGHIEHQQHDINAQLSVCASQLARCKEELDNITSSLETARKQLNQFQKDLEVLEDDGRGRSILLQQSLNEDGIQTLFQEKNQLAETYEKEIAKIQFLISELEKEIASIDIQTTLKKRTISESEAAIDRAQKARASLKGDLAQLGFKGELTENDLELEIRRTEDALRELDEILQDIERLNSILQMENLRKRIAALKRELEDTKTQAGHKKRTADNIEEWINCLTHLRGAVQRRQADSVKDQLHALQPVINLLYNRLSTHPFFTKVNVQIAGREDDQTVRFSLEPSESVALVRAPSRENRLSPGKFFSEAQINVLALSIFLAGTIQQRWSNLRTICIDDPVQQMDDMNAYAFLELIRGLANDRQFIITTCDPRFYQLAREMFECLNYDGKVGFRAYRLKFDGEKHHELIMDTPSVDARSISGQT